MAITQSQLQAKAASIAKTRISAKTLKKKLSEKYAGVEQVNTVAVIGNGLVSNSGTYSAATFTAEIGSAVNVVNVGRLASAVYAPASSQTGVGSARTSGTSGGTTAPVVSDIYLRADGTRQLEGNLAVVNGVTIDGVDISVHAANPDAHHTKLHNIVDPLHHSVTGAQLSVVGLYAIDTLGILPTTSRGDQNANTILRTGASKDLYVSILDAPKITTQPGNDLVIQPDTKKSVTYGAIISMDSVISGSTGGAIIQGVADFDNSYSRVFVGHNARWDSATDLWNIDPIGANDASGFLLRNNAAAIDVIFHQSVANAARTMTHSTFAAGAKITFTSSGYIGANTTSPAYNFDTPGTLRAQTSVITPLLTTVSGDLTIDPTGVVLFPQAQTIKTPNFNSAFPIAGFQINEKQVSGAGIGVSVLTIGEIQADSLAVKVFVADETRVDRGNQLWAKSFGIVAADFTVPSAINGTVTVTFEDSPALPGAIFSNGDWIMFQQIDRGTGLVIAYFWGTVSGYSPSSTVDEQSWTYTHKVGSVSTVGSPIVLKKGRIAIDWGQSGQAIIALSTVDESGSPYIKLMRWSGVTGPYDTNTRKTLVAIGDLGSGVGNPYYSPTGDGIWIQPGLSQTRFLVADDNNFRIQGIDLRMFNASSNQTVDLSATDGSLKLGTNIASGSTTGFAFDGTTGNITIGSASYASSVTVYGTINITGGNAAKNDFSNLTLAATIDQVNDGSTYKRTNANEKEGAGRAYSALAPTTNNLVTSVIPATAIGNPGSPGLFLGSDYMGYHNGSGTAAGWKTYLDSSGNFRFQGSTTNNYLQWSAGSNKLQGVGGGIEQWYASAVDGKLYAAGGSIGMDSTGLWLLMNSSTGWSTANAITFRSSSNWSTVDAALLSRTVTTSRYLSLLIDPNTTPVGLEVIASPAAQRVNVTHDLTVQGSIDAISGITVNGVSVSLSTHNHNSQYLALSGGTLTGTLTSRDIVFAADNTYDIGTSTNRVQDLYVVNLHVDTLVGTPEYSHYHTTSDITSGVFDIARIPTTWSVALTIDADAGGTSNYIRWLTQSATGKAWDLIGRAHDYATTSQQNDLLLTYYDGSATSIVFQADSVTKVINFGQTPTVGGTAVSLTGHTHTVSARELTNNNRYYPENYSNSVQSAIDAAATTGGTVILSGFYSITTALSMKSNVTIEGIGWDKSGINTTGNIDGIVFDGPAFKRSMALRNFRINLGSSTGNHIHFNAYEPWAITIEDMLLTGGTNSFIKVDSGINPFEVTIQRIRMDNSTLTNPAIDWLGGGSGCTMDRLYIEPGSGAYCEGLHLYNGNFTIGTIITGNGVHRAVRVEYARANIELIHYEPITPLSSHAIDIVRTGTGITIGWVRVGGVVVASGLTGNSKPYYVYYVGHETPASELGPVHLYSSLETGGSIVFCPSDKSQSKTQLYHGAQSDIANNGQGLVVSTGELTRASLLSYVQTQLDPRYVNVSGDTMSGALIGVGTKQGTAPGGGLLGYSTEFYHNVGIVLNSPNPTLSTVAYSWSGPATGYDAFTLDMRGNSDGGVQRQMAQIVTNVNTTTNNTESATIALKTRLSGTLAERLKVGGSTYAVDVTGAFRASSSVTTPSVTTASGNLTITSVGGTIAVTGALTGSGTGVFTSTLTAASDTDANNTFGRVRLGYAQATDTASFSHLDHNTNVNFALSQNSLGATALNAANGQTVDLQIAGVSQWSINASRINPRSSSVVDIGDYNRRVRSLYASELQVETLVAQNIMATIGGRIIVAPTVKLIADLSNTGIATSLNTNLQSWWSLDEASGTRNDSRGSNSLTSVNAVSSTTGKQGISASFTGTSSMKLNRTDNVSISTGDIDFAFGVWIYPTLNSGTRQTILCKGTTTTLEYKIDIDWSALGVVRWAVWNSSGVSTEVTGGSVTLNNWHFILVYHDSGGNAIGVAVNGNETSTAHTTGVRDGTGNFTLGARDTDQFYTGRIDEVAYWKNFIPDSHNRLWLYNRGIGRAYSEVNTQVQSTLDVDGNSLSVNDFAYMSAAPSGIAQIEAMRVISSASNITGGYRYTVVRNYDGTGLNNWYTGDAVVNLGGNVGEGYIDITSTSTIHNHLGPTIAIYQRTGSSVWNETVPTVAIGNLRSFVDYINDRSGLAIGNDLTLTPSTGFRGLTADATNGVRLFSTNIALYNGATQTVNIDNTGTNIWVGPSSADKRLSWNGTVLGVVGSITLSAASGFSGSGYLQVGSGNKDSTLNGWVIDGSEIVGQTSGSDQVVLNTSGKITAGAGNVVLDSVGISVIGDGSFIIKQDSTITKGYLYSSNPLDSAIVNSTGVGLKTSGVATNESISLRANASGGRVSEIAINASSSGSLVKILTYSGSPVTSGQLTLTETSFALALNSIGTNDFYIDSTSAQFNVDLDLNGNDIADVRTITVAPPAGTSAITLTTPTNQNSGMIFIAPGDCGSGHGPHVNIGRNSNVSTPAAGFLYTLNRTGAGYAWWVDNTGVARMGTTLPTNAQDTSGTAIGAQTSSLDSKNIIAPFIDYNHALQSILDAPLYDFTYKSGSYNGERFTEIITDYSPIFGMDRDGEHPYGKSLNEITAHGYEMAAIKALHIKIERLEQEIEELKSR